MALGLSSLHLDFYSQTAKKCMHRLLHTSDTQYVSMSDQPGYWPVGFLVHILWNKGWVKRLKHQAKEHQVWPLGSLSPLLNPHLTDAQFVNSFDGCSLPNLTCDPFLGQPFVPRKGLGHFMKALTARAKTNNAIRRKIREPAAPDDLIAEGLMNLLTGSQH
eukprot:1159957-Pelagomonas_calceolata.AAC.7